MSDWTDAKNNSNLPDDKMSAIRRLYTSFLKIPEKKPLKQILLCPVGLVGAGKTTVLKPMAEKLNLIRVSTDELREMLKKTDLITTEFGN